MLRKYPDFRIISPVGVPVMEMHYSILKVLRILGDFIKRTALMPV
jgi:hypothetical protein